MGSFQQTVPNFDEALGAPGSRYGSGHIEEEPGHNDAAGVAGVVDLTFTPQNTQLYTLTLSGQVITFTSDASGTAQEVRDGFAAAIAAAALADPTSPAAYVTVSEPVAATLRITESDPANRQVVVAEADANITLAQVTAHEQAQPLDGGVGVFRGPTQGSIRNTGTAATFLGIVKWSQRYGVELERNASEYEYPAGSQVPVGRRGQYVVRLDAGETVAPGDDVYVRVTRTANGAVLGHFRNDADGAAAVQITNARWVIGGSAGKAVLEINLP